LFQVLRKAEGSFGEIGVGPRFASIPPPLDRGDIATLPAEIIEEGEQVRSRHSVLRPTRG
jgi:hypothetical protein